MLSKLGLKMAAAFLAVALIAVGTVFFLTSHAVASQFAHYLEQNQAVAGHMGQGMGRMMGQMMLGTQERLYLQSVTDAMWMAALVAGGVAVLLSLILARQITFPLRRLTQAARSIAQGDLSQRVGVKGSDELSQLATAFNSMAEALAANEQARRHLVADIAHELRTPLSVIQGELEGMLDGVVEPTPAHLASVHEEAVLLGRLVSDLRELSLAEAGQLELHPAPTDLGALLRRAAAAAETTAHDHGISLTVDVPEGLPLALVDPDRISQVIHNLLSNALRYTRPGGAVTLSLALNGGGQEGKRVEGDGQKGRESSRLAAVLHQAKTRPTDSPPPTSLLVTVADTGDGISPEDLLRVFDRFYRVDKSRARASGGSGIGLAIVKQLVEAHGGQVWAESEPGKGSRFCFTLSAAP